MLNCDANDDVSKSFTFSIFNLFEQLLVTIEKKINFKKSFVCGKLKCFTLFNKNLYLNALKKYYFCQKTLKQYNMFNCSN